MDLNNSMKGQATIIAKTTSELLGEITIATRNYQDGEVDIIGNRNKLSGGAEIIAPPLSHKNLPPLYDVYTRSDFEAYSFGKAESLYTGKMGEDINSDIFIYFNLESSFSETTVFRNCILRLYCIVPEQSSSISIFALNKKFQENNTTYLNKPQKEDPITSKVIPAKSTYVDIDLTEYVKSTFYNGMNNGISVSLLDPEDDAKGFYSKEASNEALRPKLLIDYYDLADMIETNSLEGEITVTRKDRNTQDGEIYLRSTKTTTTTEQSGEIIISKPEQQGEISVVSSSSQEGEINVNVKVNTAQDGEITLYTHGKNELVSEIDLIDHKTESNGQSGNIIISKPEQLGEIKVVTSTTLDGEINLAKKDSNSLSSEINVINIKHESTEQEGEIIVTRKDSSSLLGEIEASPSKTVKTPLEGNITISKPAQLGEMSVINSTEQEGEITVNKEDTTAQEGEIVVNVDSYDNQYGEINIETSKTANNEQLAEITVNKEDVSEQEGEIQVSTSTTQEGEITVTQKGSGEQSGSINIISPAQHLGNITVSTYDTQDGEIIINNKIGMTQDGEITVSNRSSQEGEITVTQKQTDTQEAEIIVNIKETNSQEGEISLSTSTTENSEQLGEITAGKISTQEGEITVTRKDTTSQEAEITVNKKGTTQQEGTIFINNKVGVTHDGEIIVTDEKFEGFNAIIHN